MTAMMANLYAMMPSPQEERFGGSCSAAAGDVVDTARAGDMGFQLFGIGMQVDVAAAGDVDIGLVGGGDVGIAAAGDMHFADLRCHLAQVGVARSGNVDLGHLHLAVGLDRA